MKKAKNIFKYNDKKGEWIDASEEIDMAIAKAYEQGKKAERIATLEEVLKMANEELKQYSVESISFESLNDFILLLEHKLLLLEHKLKEASK